MSYRTIQAWSADQPTSFILNDAHDLNYARDDSLLSARYMASASSSCSKPTDLVSEMKSMHLSGCRAAWGRLGEMENDLDSRLAPPQ